MGKDPDHPKYKDGWGDIAREAGKLGGKALAEKIASDPVYAEVHREQLSENGKKGLGRKRPEFAEKMKGRKMPEDFPDKMREWHANKDKEEFSRKVREGIARSKEARGSGN
jgi:hypothetical protein